MRNTEERVSAVKQRVMKIEQQKRIRRSRITILSSAAVCILIIIGLASAIPGLTAELPIDIQSYSDFTASIFNISGSFGYLLIGILAFALGVCLTILCYRLQQRDLDKMKILESEIKKLEDEKELEDSNGRTN